VDRAAEGWDVTELLPWNTSGEWTCQRTANARVDPSREEVREEFSDLLGVDLSDLRIRRGDTRSRGARALSQRTGGVNEVLFDEACPTRETLAHELSHVAQRRLAGSRPVGVLGPVDGPAELEASSAAVRLARGEAVQVSRPVEADCQREALPNTEAVEVWHALNAVFDPDPSAAVEALRRGGPATREAYRVLFGRRLEQDIPRELGDSSEAMQALAVIWPAMSVGDRVEGCLGFDDDEDGLLQVLRTASDAEIAAYRSDPRFEHQLATLDGTQRLEAPNRVHPELRVQNTGAYLRGEAPAASAGDYAGALELLGVACRGPVVDTGLLLGLLTALPEPWRGRLRREAPSVLWAVLRARTAPGWVALVTDLLQTGTVDFHLGIDAALDGLTVDHSLLSAVLDHLEPARRAEVRRAWLADRQGSGDEAVVAPWRDLEARFEGLSAEDRDTAVHLLLGGAEVEELTERGRDTVELMRLRQEERLGLWSKPVEALTTTDDALELAHVQFLALHEQVPEEGDVPWELLAGLVALDRQFHQAFDRYAAAGDAIAGLAATVMATAVCVLVCAIGGPAGAAVAPTLFQVLAGRAVVVALGGRRRRHRGHGRGGGAHSRRREVLAGRGPGRRGGRGRSAPAGWAAGSR